MLGNLICTYTIPKCCLIFGLQSAIKMKESLGQSTVADNKVSRHCKADTDAHSEYYEEVHYQLAATLYLDVAIDNVLTAIF